MNPIIIITPGDLDGIGLEVSIKALANKKSNSKVAIVLIIHPSQLETYEFNFLADQLVKLNNINEALHLPAGFYYLLDSELPPFWVKKYASWTLKQKGLAALVTGPLSKTLIKKCGFHYIGHTEMLADICNLPKSSLFMFFIGQHFNVTSLTGHIPINQVEINLKSLDIKLLITQILHWLKHTQLLNHPLFILGLNPHAGEDGIIGDFENLYLKPLLNTFKHRTIGPLIPDAAFNKQNIVSGATYLGLYHDQVLIPFKYAHGFSGVHVTAGLPFLRTSVDHGTAKDIFGLKKADYKSMFDAITLAESWLPFYYDDPSRRT